MHVLEMAVPRYPEVEQISFFWVRLFDGLRIASERLSYMMSTSNLGFFYPLPPLTAKVLFYYYSIEMG